MSHFPLEQGAHPARHIKQTCKTVRDMTDTMLALSQVRLPKGINQRRYQCHVRQLSMYLCHVVLQISQNDVADAFGFDRSSVSHACRIVEIRRDEAGLDHFLASVERMLTLSRNLHFPI